MDDDFIQGKTLEAPLPNVMESFEIQVLSWYIFR